MYKDGSSPDHLGLILHINSTGRCYIHVHCIRPDGSSPDHLGLILVIITGEIKVAMVFIETLIIIIIIALVDQMTLFILFKNEIDCSLAGPTLPQQTH